MSPVERLDSLDMWEATLGLADQVAAAAGSAREVDGLPSADGLTGVLVMGMGGSGIGGDVTAAIAQGACAVPVMVSKHYECPAFVGPSTLVVASSFSGNTEETIAAATDAQARGARMVVLSSGGELSRLAAAWGAPVLPVDASIPMPRAGIGAVSVPPLVLLDRLGLLDGVDAMVAAAVEQLRSRADRLCADRSPAERLAHRIDGRLPLVYGGGALGEVAAWRWKGQFNENPKLPSWPNRVPELTHNEIAGWAVHGDITRQVLALVLLRHGFEHPQVGRRFAIIEEICTEVVGGVHTVEAEGEGPLAQFLDLTLFGDMVSLHLAELLGVDPGPVPTLDDIKVRLRA